MSIPATCPSCKASSNAPDEIAGKRVKCPKCKALMRIPLPDTEDGFDVVDSEPEARPAKRNRVRAEVDEEPIEARRKKRILIDQEDDDEDEDDRPRKGRSKKNRAGESSGVSPLRYVISGIVLVGLLVGIYFVYSYKFGVLE